MAIEKLSVILELVSGNYKKEAREAAAATSGISGAAKSVTSSLGIMMGPAAIAGAVIGLGKLAMAAGENADRLFDLQAQTGLTTDAIQEWEFVAAAAGATSEVFSDAVKAIVKNLSEAAAGTGAAADAYENLGIKVLDANGELRDAGAITDEVFEKLAGMTNVTERNALAQDIFGKKWEETISILDLGGEALADLREQGKKGVVSQESLRNADKFREAWQKFVATVGPKLNEALGKIAPALTEIAEGASDTLEALDPLLTAFGWVADRYADMKGGLDNLEESDNAFLEFLGTAGNMVVGFGGGIGALVTGIETLPGPLDKATSKTQDLDSATKDLSPTVDGAVGSIDKLTTAQRLAGDATRFHFEQLVRLGDYLAGRINTVLGAQTAIANLAAAEQAAADALSEHGRSSEEFAVAQLELALATAEAEGALGTFGANAPESIDAVATSLGISNEEARTLLETLGLLDGMTVTTTLVNRQINLLEEGVIPEGMGIGSGSGPNRIGGRQHGGPVRGGRPYLVGEAGMEMFVPGQSGSIVSNSQLMAALGRPNVGGNTYNMISSGNAALDAQYMTILATVTTLVEVQN